MLRVLLLLATFGAEEFVVFISVALHLTFSSFLILFEKVELDYVENVSA